MHGNVGLVAFGLLCGGTLAGKYSFGRVPMDEARHKNMRGTRVRRNAGTRFLRVCAPPSGSPKHPLTRPGFQSRYTSAATLKAAEDYELLAKDHGMTVLQLALAYGYSRPFMSSAILGARDPKQLVEQLEALDHVDKITPQLCRKIDRIHHVCPNPNYSDTHSSRAVVSCLSGRPRDCHKSQAILPRLRTSWPVPPRPPLRTRRRCHRSRESKLKPTERRDAIMH